MLNIPELLAPAGSMDAARAALSAGADAVYLGASAFGARASAGFDRESLEKVLNLFHFYGKRVYVTVNTLIKEKELKGVTETLRMLSDLGADAVLVQDAGAAEMIHNLFPDLCMHASTQMAIHSAEGAKTALKLGAKRVVLARECSLKTIREVADLGIEAEVFVHGAQCVCVSGQCRFSGLIGGRSGNRGRCAQPCRLPYVWQGSTKNWLSPRDMCLRDRLKELAEAGAASLKIEGRLKRPEYVTVVTSSYRRALDSLREGAFVPADGAEKEALGQVFSRSFYIGYPFGAQDAAVMNPERVSAAGIEIGKITACSRKNDVWLATAVMLKDLHNGDGLQIRGGREQDCIYSGNGVKAGQSATLRLHFPAKSGEKVIRIDDEKQLSAAREDAKNLPGVAFDGKLVAWPGKSVCLSVTDGNVSVQVAGDTVQAAQNAPLDIEKARRAIEKCGDSGFSLRKFDFEGVNAFLPAAALNALRRDALEQLTEKRLEAYKRPEPGNWEISAENRAKAGENPLLYAQTGNENLCGELLRSGADRIIYAPADIRKENLKKKLAVLPRGTIVLLPVQLADEDLREISALCTQFSLSACAGNVGQLPFLAQHSSLPLYAGEGVPVWNHRAAAVISALGAGACVLPRELTGGEIADLQAAAPDVSFILPVYGRARLMYLNHCPARTAAGLKTNRAACRMCDEGRGCLGQSLVDRMGEAFPLLPLRTDAGCLIQLLSSKARALNGAAPRNLSWLLDFTTESSGEQCALVSACRALMDGRSAELPPLYLERFEKGVE